jgi:hypothetical protein
MRLIVIKEEYNIKGVEITEKDLRNQEDCCIAQIAMMDGNKCDLISDIGEELILKLKMGY